VVVAHPAIKGYRSAMMGFAIAFALTGAVLIAEGSPAGFGTVLLVVAAVLFLASLTRRS